MTKFVKEGFFWLFSQIRDIRTCSDVTTLYEMARLNLKQKVDLHELDTENTRMF